MRSQRYQPATAAAVSREREHEVSEYSFLAAATATGLTSGLAVSIFRRSVTRTVEAFAPLSGHASPLLRAATPVCGAILVVLLRTATGGFSPGLAGQVTAVSKGVVGSNSAGSSSSSSSSEGGAGSGGGAPKPKLAQHLSKAAAAVCTLGSGNSMGPEGPAVELGVTSARAIDTYFFSPPFVPAEGEKGARPRLSQAQRVILVAAGAAAGVAAGFNAPLAGVLFAKEAILNAHLDASTSASTSSPAQAKAGGDLALMLSAASAAAVSHVLVTPTHALSALSSSHAAPLAALSVKGLLLRQAPLFVLLGCFCALVAHSFAAASHFFAAAKLRAALPTTTSATATATDKLPSSPPSSSLSRTNSSSHGQQEETGEEIQGGKQGGGGGVSVRSAGDSNGSSSNGNGDHDEDEKGGKVRVPDSLRWARSWLRLPLALSPSPKGGARRRLVWPPFSALRQPLSLSSPAAALSRFALSPVGAAVACGVVGLAVPQVLFQNGEPALHAFLRVAPGSGSFLAVPPTTALLVLGCKVLLTALCVASGLIGGAFAPSLVMGAAAGSALATTVLSLTKALAAAAPWWSPAPLLASCFGATAAANLLPVTLSVVGAAATLAAVFRAPMTGTLLVFELTQDYGMVLPALVANSVACALMRRK